MPDEHEHEHEISSDKDAALRKMTVPIRMEAEWCADKVWTHVKVRDDGQIIVFRVDESGAPVEVARLAEATERKIPLEEIRAESGTLEKIRDILGQQSKMLRRWIVDDCVDQLERRLRELDQATLKGAALRNTIFNEVHAATKVPPTGTRTIMKLVDRVEALENRLVKLMDRVQALDSTEDGESDGVPSTLTEALVRQNAAMEQSLATSRAQLDVLKRVRADNDN